MSVHISRGLLPEGPCCHYHGKTMELTDLCVPVFGVTRYNNAKLKHAGRKIYRCKVRGCTVVAAGPTDPEHSPRELSLEYVNPW